MKNQLCISNYLQVSFMKSISALYQDLRAASCAVDSAVHGVNLVHANRGKYFYTVLVEEKHRTHFCGFRGEPDYTYRNETRFNQQRFDNDLAAANAKQEEKEQALSTVVSEIVVAYGLEESQVNQQAAAVKSASNSVRSEIAGAASNLQSIQSVNRGLDNEVNTHNRTLMDLKGQLHQLESEITYIGQQTSHLRGVHDKNQLEIKDLQGKVSIDQDGKDAREVELNKQMEEMVNSMSESHRSDLLMKFRQQKDPHFKKIIELILAKEFDVNYQDASGHNIWSSAIISGDMELFDLVMKKYPSYNLELPTVNGMTLLEYCISHGRQDFTGRIFDNCSDFSRTCLRALKGNNIKVLAKIFENSPAATGTMYHGNSLLHLAILSNRPEVMEKILSVDHSATFQLNSKGDSCFTLALKTGSQATILSLIKHIDIKEQINKLIENSQTDLLAKLFEAAPALIDDLDPGILSGLIAENKLDLATMLIDYGFDTSAAIETMVNQNDQEALVGLYNLGVDYLLSSKFDKQTLSLKFSEFGYNSIAEELTPIIGNDQLIHDETHVTGQNNYLID
jgi:ankyrin repeat protein